MAYICKYCLKILSKKFQNPLESDRFRLYFILSEEHFLFSAHYAGFFVSTFPTARQFPTHQDQDE